MLVYLGGIFLTQGRKKTSGKTNERKQVQMNLNLNIL